MLAVGPPSADNCGQVRETRALFVLLSSCCPVFPTSSFYYVSSKLFLSYFSYRLHLPYFTTSSFHPTFVTSYFIPTFQQAVLVLLSNERFLSYFPTSGFCPTFRQAVFVLLSQRIYYVPTNAQPLYQSVAVCCHCCTRLPTAEIRVKPRDRGSS